MKLNGKRTILVGFAFLSICAFWQMYDNTVPVILKHTFGVGDTVSGFIMSLDNILALFMLPLFGRLSDRCKSKYGKRTPFIVAGTVLAVVFTAFIPLADRHVNLPLFVALLGLVLLAMSTYRSPAVALMPDVTPKPLRSKANAIINLMGALGGVLVLLTSSFFVRESADTGRNDFTFLYLFVAGVMVVSVLILILTVNERKLTEENAQSLSEPAEAAENGGKLPRPVFRSLCLILASVSFWFMGYNAVTTSFTKYYMEMWGTFGGASRCLLLATACAVISYIPVGILSSKLGRKKVIMAGVVLLAVCFGLASFVRAFHFYVYILFGLVGFAWAAINVNSYPMVVEIARGSDIGKYTGYYYTFSMAAQIITPIVSGYLLEHVGYWTLFPYSAVLVACALITMAFMRHGDSRPDAPQGKMEAFEAMDS